MDVDELRKWAVTLQDEIRTTRAKMDETTLQMKGLGAAYDKYSEHYDSVVKAETALWSLVEALKRG